MTQFHHDNGHHRHGREMRPHDIRPHVHECDDQLPIFATAARGPQGDGYVVTIEEDSTDETKLAGWIKSGRTGELTSDWVTENINGGELKYYYNLYPADEPPSFTMTFVYSRPGREEWSWTTPKIPYIYQYGKDMPDGIIGSGVATLFIKRMNEDWVEKLIYPDGTTREDFNAPEQGEAWTVNIDLSDVPGLDELSKILGISPEDLNKLILDQPWNVDGSDYDDLKDYIDKQDDAHQKAAEDHFHEDLGFPDGSLEGDGGEETDDQPWNTVKEYIDWSIETTVNSFNDQSLYDKIWAGTSVQPWGGSSYRLFVENIDLPTGQTLADWIKSNLNSIDDTAKFYFNCNLGDDRQLAGTTNQIAIDSHWSVASKSIEMRLVDKETGLVYDPATNFSYKKWSEFTDVKNSSNPAYRVYWQKIYDLYGDITVCASMVRVNWIVAKIC